MLNQFIHFVSGRQAFSVVILTFSISIFSQTIEQDPVTGLTSRENGLSCANVYLSDGSQIIKRNTFVYGETFYVNFDGMEGFNRENKCAFPDMQLMALSRGGDTVLLLRDVYKGYVDGIENTPLQLYAELTAAFPFHSQQTYTLYVHIRDKKGTGSYQARLEFHVVHNKRISVQSNLLTCGEIYLFSRQRNHAEHRGCAVTGGTKFHPYGLPGG